MQRVFWYAVDNRGPNPHRIGPYPTREAAEDVARAGRWPNVQKETLQGSGLNEWIDTGRLLRVRKLPKVAR